MCRGCPPGVPPRGETADHALGRSRGGSGTKIHLLACGNAVPVRVVLTAGQAHESIFVEALGIGWHTALRTFTFATRDAGGRIVGIRTRHIDGRKLCLTGSALGLVLPGELLRHLDLNPIKPPQAVCDTLLICEGESDAAAALDLGFVAIGRLGRGECSGIVVDAVRRLRLDRVVVIADNDGPGRDGADALASKLSANGTGCRVQLLTDAKDLRAWKAKPGNDCHALAALLDAPADLTPGLR